MVPFALTESIVIECFMGSISITAERNIVRRRPQLRWKAHQIKDNFSEIDVRNQKINYNCLQRITGSLSELSKCAEILRVVLKFFFLFS